jgi:chitinase
VTVDVGSTVRFSASVTGATNTSVLWTIAEDEGGTISGDGAYTAPSAPGVFHIIATSQADNTRVGQATITVQAGNATGIIQ